jgi:acetylglutamate/LysW-gamma-L-alpha-aminoadipate kinase
MAEAARPAGLTVVKCGGAAGIDSPRLCADIAALAAGGERVVLVHGGSAALNRLAGRLGVQQGEIRSPGGVAARHTDSATLEVLMLAVLGQVQPALLAELGRLGVPAIGLSGLDAGLIRARRKKALRAAAGGRVTVIRDDHSGKVVAVNGELLRALLGLGILPVVSPPAVAEDGGPVNANADRIAAAVAAELAAPRLVFLTAAAGLLADPADPASLLAEYALPPGETLPAMARGGMLPKLIAAREALRAGVHHVVIADGRRDSPVSRALAGAGTRIRHIRE